VELAEFVQKTIEQVINGVAASCKHAKASNAHIGKQNYTPIEFDVAVTVTEGSESKKGGGITVWGVGANAEGKSATTNSSVSRIKFSVDVSLPRTISRRSQPRPGLISRGFS
jgi:hypothetical protein